MSDWGSTYCYNAELDKLRTLNLSLDKEESSFISHVTMKNDSTFFACTPNSMLCISFDGTDYIHANTKISKTSFDQFKHKAFIKNRITDLYVDNKNNVMWIGTFGKGMLKSSLMDKDITRILLNEDLLDMNGIAEDAKGYIWLTTEHHGVWRSTENQLTPNMTFKRWE
jgi:ligand-binding sensor domain-containing protein